MKTTQLTQLRYQTPTATLAATVRPAAISQWSESPVVQVLRFQLQLQFTDTDEPVDIWGDGTAFIGLNQAVQSYLQGWAIGEETVVQASSEPVVKSLEGPFHALHLGRLTHSATDSILVLGSVQLADLGAVFEQLETQVRPLPLSLRPPVQRRWRDWAIRGGTVAAGAIAAVGVTITLRSIEQPTVSNLPEITSAPAPQSAPEPDASAQSSAASQSQSTISSDARSTSDESPTGDAGDSALADSPGEGTTQTESPHSPSISPVVPTSPSTSAPPPFPEVAATPSPPASSPRVSNESLSGNESPSSGESEALLDLDADAGTGDAAPFDAALAPAAPPPVEPGPPETEAASEAVDLPEAEAGDLVIPPSAAPITGESPGSQTSAPTSRSPLPQLPAQVAALQASIADGWEPLAAVTQPLRYTLVLGADGRLANIIPENRLAQHYRDRVELPALGDVIGPIDSVNRIQIVLEPNGTVQVIPLPTGD